MDENKYNSNPGYVVPAAGTVRCGCNRCRCRGLMAPAVLITLGALFMMNEFGVAHFHRTWPILLIVIGLVKILGGNADMTGHVDVYAPPPPPVPAAPTQSSEPRQVDHV
ncbi:MAG: LiaI-LiaF-like domain-containing protein [Terriglobales bacterium]